jgi:hypothetical protein
MPFRASSRRFAGAVAIATMATAATLAATSPAQAATNFFRIDNFNSHLALTATSATDHAQVVQANLSSSNFRQQWAIRTNSGTAALTYVLRQKISAGGQLVDGCLDLPRDVDRDQQFAGEVLVVRPCDGTNSQRWLDVNTNSSQGTANLENKLSLMKIDVDNNKPLSPGAVAIQNDVSQPSQRFFRAFVASA